MGGRGGPVCILASILGLVLTGTVPERQGLEHGGLSTFQYGAQACPGPMCPLAGRTHHLAEVVFAVAAVLDVVHLQHFFLTQQACHLGTEERQVSRVQPQTTAVPTSFFLDPSSKHGIATVSHKIIPLTSHHHPQSGWEQESHQVT